MVNKTSPHIPAAIVLTAWMLLWAPIILWAYGPQNFLWLCNIAIFLILFSLWTGNRVILSSQAGTVILIGIVWTIDFLLGLATQGRLVLITAYMWNPENPLAARIVSVYHIFLPLLVYRVLIRWGYDNRGPWLQCVIGGLAISGAWWLTEMERNVNWVHMHTRLEQPWLSGPVWLAALLILAPLLIYYPGHRLVRFLLREK